MAAVSWPEVITALEEGHLPCSGGESRLLKIVASLAEGIPVDLRDTLTGMDATTIGLVAAAVLHTRRTEVECLFVMHERQADGG